MAALAAAAVPGFDPALTTLISVHAEDVEVAGIIGADGRRIVLAAPQSDAAGAQVQKDLAVAETLSHSHLKGMVERPLGAVATTAGRRAFASEPAPGAPVMLDRLGAHDLAPSLATAIAAIHSVPVYIPERAGIEVFTASALRTAHRSRVQRAVSTGHVGELVTERWEAVLADDELWDFETCFVHGSLSEETLFAHDDRITGITQWHAAAIGDPAHDVAWLRSSLPADDAQEFLAAYAEAMPVPLHPRFEERAHVLGELAIADWLLHGVDTADESIIEDGRGMLADLEEDLAEARRREQERREEERRAAEHEAAERAAAEHDDEARGVTDAELAPHERTTAHRAPQRDDH